MISESSFATAGFPVSIFPYGRNPNHDAGTDGDVFVDGANGLDTNDGLTSATAVKTIAKGMTVVNALAGDRVLRIMGDGVKYRESVLTNYYNPFPNPPIGNLAVKSYGTDLPWISGAEKVTGFVACTSADDPILTAAKRPNVYKAVIPKTLISGHVSYWRMMLREYEEPLILAQLQGATRIGRTVPKFFIDSSLSMMGKDVTPDLVISLNGSNQIDKITHPSVLGAYSDAQLEQTVAAVLVYPNFVEHIKTASSSSGVLQMAANTRNFNGSTDYRYNLLNLPPAIEAGGWAYRDNGDGNLTIYVWPKNPASLADGIEVAARDYAWKHSHGSARTIRFEGLGFEMCATNDTVSANGGSLLFLNLGDNKTVSQCAFRFLSGKQNFLLNDKWGNNVRWEYCSFRWGQGCYGAGFSGQTSAMASGNRLLNCLFEDLSFTPWRHAGQSLCATAHVLIRRTSAGGHANTYDYKLTSDQCLGLGQVVDMSASGRPYQGYATNQTASRIYYLHSVFPTSSDGRSYVDQTGSTDVLPYAGGDCALINCWTPHEVGGVWPSYGTIMVGKNTPVVNWKLYNNVTPKIVSTGGTLDRKNNLLTSTSAATAGTGEEVVDYQSVYTNPDNRDWSAKAGGPLPGKSGTDVSAIVAQLESWFPDIDFTKDAWGRPWNPAAPGVGPWGSFWPDGAGKPTI